jgi:hypothetical protein
MRSSLKCVGISIIALLTNFCGFCQFVKVPGEITVPNTIFVSVGVEPEVTTNIGYVHTIGRASTMDWQMGGSIKIAPLIISDGAWRANFLTVASSSLVGAWRNTVTSQVYIAHGRNRGGSLTGFGIELRDNPVLFGKRWVKGIDLGFQYTPFTYIKNSEEAKEAFRERYPDGDSGQQEPRDGWYKNAASRLRLGLTAGTKIGNASSFQISSGSLLVLQKQGIGLAFSHAQVPVYLELMYKTGW